MEPGTCSGTTPVCLAGGNECVQCNVDADCTDAAKAKCDTTTNECVPCDDSAQCAHVDGKNVCGAGGACVECTPETEATDCGDNACDPDTFECTETRRKSLGTCRPCRSDSECGADRKCIRVPFMGSEGEYHCMQVVPAGGCPPPYKSSPIVAESKNHVAAAQYCSHNTMAASCDAIASLTGSKDCSAETAEAACGPGGVCGTVTTTPNKCTYKCSGDAFCPSGYACNEEGASPSPYCGGPL